MSLIFAPRDTVLQNVLFGTGTPGYTEGSNLQVGEAWSPASNPPYMCH